MSGLLNIAQSLQPFDLGQSIGRMDQMQGNALALAMQRRQVEQAKAYDSAIQQFGPGVASTDPRQRLNALAGLMQTGGERGAAYALPLLQQERENSWAYGDAPAGGGGDFMMPQAAPVATALPAPAPAQRAAVGGSAAAATAPPASSAGGMTERQREAVNWLKGARAEALATLDGPALDARMSQINEQAGVMMGRRPGASSTSFGGAGAGPVETAPTAAPTAAPAGGGLVDPGMVQRALRAAANGNVSAQRYLAAVGPFLNREQRAPITVSPGSTVYDPNSGRPLYTAPRDPSQDPLVEIRRPDGSTVQVPRSQAAGMVSAPAPSNETVLVPDPNSATGFRYVSKADAARTGMPAPAPEGYRPPQTTSTVAVLKRDAQGNDMPGTSELVATPQSVGRTPATSKEDPAFDRTRGMRNDFQALQPVKDYMAVLPQVQAIRSAANVNTAAADLDIVYAFAKILDPTSVVREGEADGISRTGGIWDTLNAAANRAIGGARLSPGVRGDLLAQAESRFTSFSDNYDSYASRYRKLAEEANLNPDQVAQQVARPTQARTGNAPPAPGTTPPAAPAAPPAQPAAAGVTRPANGWTVRELRSMPDNDFQAFLGNTGALTNQEKAALAAELTRRTNRMGAADGR